MTTVYLQKLNDSKKKIKVTIFFKNGTKKIVQFGAAGYSDYTKHKDPERKKRYDARHTARENWTKSGMKTAGFWSKWILWSKPSLSAAIKFTENKFNIKIKRGAPPKTSLK